VMLAISSLLGCNYFLRCILKTIMCVNRKKFISRLLLNNFTFVELALGPFLDPLALRLLH
jgi:hypothetical protein